MSLSSELVVAPALLQHRVRALRNRRVASRFSGGIKRAAWTSVFAVVGGGLLDGH